MLRQWRITIEEREKAYNLMQKFKVALGPGEEKSVYFEIGFYELREWSVNKKYELFEMDVDIKVGQSSDSIVLAEKIHIG